MNDQSLARPPASAVQFGIHALPLLSSGMVSGGLYVLLAEIPSARFPILAGSLASALETGTECNVIIPANPELFIQRINSFGELDAQESMAADQLHLFLMQEEFAKKMFRFGAESFTQELERFDIPNHSYLIFDQADELLSLHDISMALDQVEVLSKWFADRQITVLLVFTRATEAHANTINAMMDNLTGIARLGGDKSGLEITFDYWQSPEGAVAARRFPLQARSSGIYEVTTLPVAPTHVQGSNDDITVATPEDPELRVFYMDPDLGSLAKQSAGFWQQVDTLVGMMHATRNTPSATIILSFQPESSLRQLAETVHTLRLSLGRKAHLVVQEKMASLRFQNEALLLRLGVNLVIHRDVPVSRLTLLLDSLQGQSFSRDVDINFEAALESVTPTRMRGYLRPLRFAREVNLILDRAETLNIPCALIVGSPINGQTLINVLHKVGLSRPGDLLTADNDFVYIFLNACQQAVMLSTLERILNAPMDSLFSDTRFLIRREEIQPELLALLRAAETGDLPDHGTALASDHAEEGTTLEPASQLSAVTSIFSKLTAASETAMPPPHPGNLIVGNTLTPGAMGPQPTPPAASNESTALSVESKFIYREDQPSPMAGQQKVARAVRRTQSSK